MEIKGPGADFMDSDELREDRVRNELRGLGYKLEKSTIRKPENQHVNNCGGYRIWQGPDMSGYKLIAGGHFDLTLDQVEEWAERLTQKEAD